MFAGQASEPGVRQLVPHGLRNSSRGFLFRTRYFDSRFLRAIRSILRMLAVVNFAHVC